MDLRDIGWGFHLAQDRDQRWVLVNTVMIFLMFASCCVSITNNTNSTVNATIVY
jgi:hypothetical protein